MGAVDLFDPILGNRIADHAARDSADNTINVTILPTDVHINHLIGIHGKNDRGIHQDYLPIRSARFDRIITGPVEARTSDGQVVLVDASVIFSVDPNQVVNVHIRWQDRYVDGVVRAISRGVIRDTVSQYGIEQVYSTHREEMTNTIKSELTRRFAENGLFLVDFVLRNIAFSADYSASVEQKQIAEQLAQQAAFTVEQRRQEAEQARQVAQGLADAVVIKAQGRADARLIGADAEAQAIELLAAALALNPDVLTLEYIQKLAPNIQVMLVPTENPFLLPLPSIGGGPASAP